MTAWPAENKLAAPYHVSPAITGFEELDLYGSWDTVPDCRAVWYSELDSRAVGPLPRRPMGLGRALGMDWVDAGPWGFAPFHYGR